MSILDDVRRLASEEPTRHTECIHCSAIRDFPDCVEDHASDCPWLSMPKIVAVLEAAAMIPEIREDPDRDADLHRAIDRLCQALQS